jgi:uncharacterized membrane protein
MSHPNHLPSQAADEHVEQQRVEAARRYVQQLHAFHVHAGVFAGGVLVMFVVNLATNAAAGIAGDLQAWWSAWALIGWGIGIAVHGLVVRLNRPASSSSTWEQRQIDKVLAR